MSNDDHWESVLEGYGVEPETVLEKIKNLEAENDRLQKVLKLTPKSGAWSKERIAELRKWFKGPGTRWSDSAATDCLDEIERLQNITKIQQKQIERLNAENEHLNKVLKLTPDEILAAGFCHGLSTREDEIVDDFDRKLLETAGKCIDRIINQQEAP